MPDYLPMSQQYNPRTRMMELAPTGLDLQRKAEAKQRDKLQLMHEAVNERLRQQYFEKKMGVDQNSQLESRIRAKAEYDATIFEKRYTTKQKADLAQLEQARNAAMSNPNFSDNERIAIGKAVDMRKLKIQPSMLPRLSPYPQGRGPGDIWNEDGIGKVTMNADGNLHVIQGWKDSAEGAAAQHANEITKEEMKARAKLLYTPIEETNPNYNPNIDNGQPERIKRFRTPDEVNNIMNPPPESNAAGRTRVAAMRQEAGMPPVPVPQAPGAVSGNVSPTTTGITIINNETDFQQLAPGAVFIGPDGQRYQKPKRQQ